jgi:hypothetical protein
MTDNEESGLPEVPALSSVTREEVPRRPRRSWHPPQFILTDVADTDGQLGPRMEGMSSSS